MMIAALLNDFKEEEENLIVTDSKYKWEIFSAFFMTGAESQLVH